MLPLEPYTLQSTRWPAEGQHILAHFDATSIIVYQAYRPAIAEYAVALQRLDGPDFSVNRMTWIKPNFLWMMYRSGWATKADQERILAIRITREGFDAILRSAVPSSLDRARYTSDVAWKQALAASDVRLQWDPDHAPNGAPLARRAIQLGLAGHTLRRYLDEWIVAITDFTPVVREQHANFQKDIRFLATPVEHIYPKSEVV